MPLLTNWILLSDNIFFWNALLEPAFAFLRPNMSPALETADELELQSHFYAFMME